MSISPVTDVSYPFIERRHQTSIASRRWAPTSDIDSVSFVESPTDSDADDERSVLLSLCSRDVVEMRGPTARLTPSSPRPRPHKLFSEILNANVSLAPSHYLTSFNTGFLSYPGLASSPSLATINSVKATQNTDPTQWPRLILYSPRTRLLTEEPLLPLCSLTDASTTFRLMALLYVCISEC